MVQFLNKYKDRLPLNHIELIATVIKGTRTEKAGFEVKKL